MKIVAFNGSPRKGGNTEQLIEEVFKPIREARNRNRTNPIRRKMVKGMCLLLHLF